MKRDTFLLKIAVFLIGIPIFALLIGLPWMKQQKIIKSWLICPF